ncbi:MAG: hypothetical protein HYS32_00075 [Candidatus Woesearchaeota archaeon]|nr:MAG: hypothetical protein HYS32_00075 [Candidatus Woesearchaeota archaeon]
MNVATQSRTDLNIRELLEGRTPVTHLGSLPHSDIRSALDFTFEWGIPALPELYNLGEKFEELPGTVGGLSCAKGFRRYC